MTAVTAMTRDHGDLFSADCFFHHTTTVTAVTVPVTHPRVQ
jgi:hypothetical protein